MKVYITGVAGFLGSHLAEYFLNLGHQVSGIDNLIGGYEDNVVDGVDFLRADMADLDRLQAHIGNSNLLINAACTAYEGLSVFSPALVTQNTIQISVNAMVAAITCGVDRFVQCSSMARYGAQDEVPFREEMNCKPQDPYGIAKLSAEQILRNLAEVHGVDFVIAVPHNIIGPRQKYDDPFRNVASIMINLMLQGRQPIIYGDGRQVRCFSDIDDDLSCLSKLALDEKSKGNIFNIGPDEEPIEIIDLAKIIAKEIGFNLDPIFLPDRPQEVKYATCSADKIRKYFGYSTSVTLGESIEKMIAYIDARGPKPFEYHLPLEISNSKTPESWVKRMF